jgi:hypothetical protein
MIYLIIGGSAYFYRTGRFALSQTAIRCDRKNLPGLKPEVSKQNPLRNDYIAKGAIECMEPVEAGDVGLTGFFF